MRQLVVLVVAVVLAVGGVTIVPQAAESVVPGGVGRIAFVSNRDGLPPEIYTRDFAGGPWQRLTSNSVFDGDPAWSPDGTEIAYVSGAGSYDIWVMDSDGGNKRNLTMDGFENLAPDWSPDGTRIVFSSDTVGTGRSDLWVMNADGSDRKRLTSSTNYWGDWEPAWSPNGESIAFQSTRDGREDVWVMSSSGSQMTNLTKSMTGPSWQPAWSPDGSKIAFTSTFAYSDLYVMDAAGSGVMQLTNSASSSAYDPAWSPDGRHILFESHEDGDTDLWMVDPDGSNLGHLTDHPGSEMQGAWESVPPPSTVGLVDPGSGVWQLRDGAGVVSQFYYGNPGDYPFMGDWDCDGVDTPGLYRQSDGFAYLRNSNTQGTADRTFFFGDPADIPLAGDFNGDGCDTLSIYRPSEARFYIINQLGADGGGLGAADYSFLFGDAGDKPVVGDWDGDRTDEIGLHRETSGFFYYRNTLTTGIADGQFYFGDPGDRFVAGDWGVVDGVETPAMFRPSNTTFYFRHTLTQGIADHGFIWTGAGTNWLPVSGEFTLD